MKMFIKRLSAFLLTMMLLFTSIATGITANATSTDNPVDSLKFSPCVGYTRVWDAKYPCAGDLVIPAYRNGLPVTHIWTSALNYTNITSVVIPDTVTSLASGYNFDGCRQLKSVVMSNNVSIIPNNAFSNCDVLETVVLGSGVTKIYCNAFINCPKLEYIEFPLGIEEIRSNAFYNGVFYLDGNGLQCAYYPGTVDQWNQVDVEDYTVKNCVLYQTYVKSVTADVKGVKITADDPPGAKEYTFYRQEKINGKWTDWSLVKTTESAVCIDEKAVGGHTYRYAVTASNGPYTTNFSASRDEYTYVRLGSAAVKTLKNINGKWYLYKDGVKSTDTTLVKHTNGIWYYVNKGVIDFTKTGLVKYTDGKHYYVENGRINFTKTGLIKHTDGNYYLVKNGVKTNSTTLFKHTNGRWYYVQNGKVIFSKTGLVKYTDGKHYYVENGSINFSKTALIKHTDGNYYHVKNGVKTNSTLLFKHTNGRWYYVQNGKVIFSKTGLVKHSDGKWYYVNKGSIDFTKNGKVYHNGKYYTVKNGVVVLK